MQFEFLKETNPNPEEDRGSCHYATFPFYPPFRSIPLRCNIPGCVCYIIPQFSTALWM